MVEWTKFGSAIHKEKSKAIEHPTQDMFGAICDYQDDSQAPHVCLFVCLLVCLFVCLFACLFVCLFVCSFVFL